MENTEQKTCAQLDYERNGEVKIFFKREEEKIIGGKFTTKNHIIHIENKNIFIDWNEKRDKKIIVYDQITKEYLVIAGKKRQQKDFIDNLVLNMHNDTKIKNIENALKCMCIKYSIGA